MERGWIKLYRRLQDNDLWLEKPFSRGQAWVDLLLLANHKPGSFWNRGICIKVNRGEVGKSQIKLAERWGWSRGKVRRFLVFLKNGLQIEQRTVQQNKHLTSLIIILNYDEYQMDGTINGTTSKPADGQQTNSRQYSNKNEKNGKNEKKEDIYTTVFEEVWKKYPLKAGKAAAEKHFKKSVKNAEDSKAIYIALDKYKKYVEGQRKSGFPELKWKNGSTWFKSWRDWIDFEEPEVTPKGGTPSGPGKYDGIGIKFEQS